MEEGKQWPIFKTGEYYLSGSCLTRSANLDSLTEIKFFTGMSGTTPNLLNVGAVGKAEFVLAAFTLA